MSENDISNSLAIVRLMEAPAMNMSKVSKADAKSITV